MATKNYMINDKWLDIDKQNIVELQSVDGVLDSLKVNGSEIETPSGKITITENGTDIDIAQYALADVNVEGGGGSSDFSTVEVVVTNSTSSNYILSGFAAIVGGLLDDHMSYGFTVEANSTKTVLAVLYKNQPANGKIEGYTSDVAVAYTGDITDDDDGYFIIEGDGTITMTGN